MQQGLDLATAISTAEPSNKVWVRGKIELTLDIMLLNLWQENTNYMNLHIDKIKQDLDSIISENTSDDNAKRLYAVTLYAEALGLFKENKINASYEIISKIENLISEIQKNQNEKKLKLVLLSDTLLLKHKILYDLKNFDAANTAYNTLIAQLQPIATSTKDYKILDPWIRTNIFAGNRKKVNEDINLLTSIGYRRPDYLNFIKNMRERDG
jgi:hypothetical protein